MVSASLFFVFCLRLACVLLQRYYYYSFSANSIGVCDCQLQVEEWKSWTLSEYLSECKVAARAFMAMGLGPKDAVAICKCCDVLQLMMMLMMMLFMMCLGL